jgi:hypothetical protein
MPRYFARAIAAVSCFLLLCGFISGGSGTYQNVAQAYCKNAAGDGAIIQAAVNTGQPVQIIGPCIGDTAVTLSTQGQQIFGPATINVTSVVSGNGTFVCNTGPSWNTGPVISDLTMLFTQPRTSARASLTNYKAAIYARDCFDLRIHRVRIEQAMVGIDAIGDSGQLHIDDLDISCLSVCISIDGSTDSDHFARLHVWAFGANLVQEGGTNADGCGAAVGTNLCAIYNAPNTTGTPQTTSGSAGPIGIYSGRMDGLYISDSLFLIGQNTYFFHGTRPGVNGDTLAFITNVDFDTYGGLYIATGQIAFGNGFVSTIASGQIGVENVAGVLTMTGNMVNLAASSTAVKIDSGAVAATVVGNTPITPVGGGSATFISVAADGNYRVIGNSTVTGYANACPTTQTTMRSANNGTAANSTCN